MRRLAGFAPVVLLATVGTATAGGAGVAGVEAVVGAVAAQEPAPHPASLGERPPEVRADYDWTLRTLDGDEVSLEEYRGRPVFLNLWATWCAPCVAELASIEALASRPEATGVAFLLVSPEEPEVVDRFRRRQGLSLPVLVEGTRMPSAWGLRALPTTWIVDAGGRVALRHRGAADWDRPEVAALLEALARGER